MNEKSFWAELKRRRVYNVAAWYVAAVFVVWQVADIVVPSLDMPAWTMKAIIIVSAAGLVPALVLAWIYDIHPTTPRDPTRPRSRLRLTLAVLTIVVFGSGGWWAVSNKIRPAPANLSDISLAVFPFSVRSGGSLAYLREGLVDLLSRNLGGATTLQPLDPSLMLKVTRGEDSDVATAGTIAREVGAGRFVTGTVTGNGSRVRIDATLYQLRDSVHQVTSQTVEGDTTQLFALVDQLTAGLLSALAEGAASEQMVRTAATTTQSLPALKAYLEGEQHFRQGDHGEAVHAFSRALELDSTFVLAQYRMAMSYHMNTQYWLARLAIQPVTARAERLTAHDRRVVEAFAALHDGKVAQAEAAFRTIAFEFPRDIETRVLLSNVLTNYGQFRGQSSAEALTLLKDVFEADPKFACIYCALSLLYQSQQKYDDEAKVMLLMQRERGGDSTRLGLATGARLALLRGDTAAANAYWPAFDADTSVNHDGTAYHLADYALSRGNTAWVEELLAHHPFGHRRPVNRQTVTTALRLARGQWELAGQELMAGMRPDDPAAVGRLELALLRTPFEMQASAFGDVGERVRQWLPDTSAQPINEVKRSERGRRIFMLGIAASRRGNANAATLYADSLRILAQNPMDAGNVSNARRVLLADRALRENKPAQAISHLEAISYELRPGQLLSWSGMFDYAMALRVRGYLALGRNADAQRWLLHGVGYWGAPIPGSLYPIYVRDLATVYDRLGDTDNAKRNYAAFIQVWQNADPALQPQVESARKRLKMLMSPS